jgi:AcrR family transcriptional regulator
MDTSGRVSRREQQRDETRRDLAMAAYALAVERGVAEVRVPDIAAAAGVSTRTFNNYFTSKEEAIVWPAGQHAAGVASRLRERPAAEPLGDALVEAVTGMYGPAAGRRMAAFRPADFRALVMAEPSLHGAYLKSAAIAERALADAIAERLGTAPGDLPAVVLAGMVVGAERAAVMHWMRHHGGHHAGRLVDAVRTAIRQATAGLGTGLGGSPGGGLADGPDGGLGHGTDGGTDGAR